MTTATRSAQPRVWVGVDTHQLTHHAAVVTGDGMVMATQEFPATTAGYTELAGWAGRHGLVQAAGIEQTGSYGAGLARYLTGRQWVVVEVNQPDIAARAKAGKTDQLDAVMAARAVASGRAAGAAKDTTGPVEAVRNLKIARDSAVKARTVAVNELRDVITTAPAALRERLLPLTTAARVAACAALRPEAVHTAADVVLAAVKTTLQTLARRIQDLTTQDKHLAKAINQLMKTIAPTLLAARQVGPHTAAQLVITAGQNLDRMTSEASFARLCGAAPIPASSGKTTRHRLHRGGDRQANSALYLIVVGRMKNHLPTQAYVTRRQTEGKTTKEIIRCLKRFVAREIYHALKTDLVPEIGT